MMDYYKRKLAKHTEYDAYARCSGHEQVESSVPEVTDEVGSSQYALVSPLYHLKFVQMNVLKLPLIILECPLLLSNSAKCPFNSFRCPFNIPKMLVLFSQSSLR